MKKLGTFHNQQGNMIVSAPAFLATDQEVNITIPVAHDSKWTA